MHQSKRWALSLGLIAAALLLANAPAWAEDEMAPEGAEPAAKIQWVEGWEAGAKAAAEQDKLIFLYFGRHTPR